MPSPAASPPSSTPAPRRHRDGAQAPGRDRQGLRRPQRHHRRADRGPDRHQQGIGARDRRADAHAGAARSARAATSSRASTRIRAQYERLIEVFRAHDIGYFFYNGGNDSADTCLKVSQIVGAPGLSAHRRARAEDRRQRSADDRQLPGLRLGREVRRDVDARGGVRRRVDGEDVDARCSCSR